MAGYLRSLNPQLPRSVQILQLGGLANAVGNGLVLPFAFIYLHNERGFSLGLAGLILGTNAAVSLIAGPLSGPLVDRFGGRRMLAVALGFLAVGFGGYAFVESPWHGFLASAITGIGNGIFWPAQSTLIAGLTPPERRPAAFAMQRVVMNLGIGIGGLAGGFLGRLELSPRSSSPTRSPSSPMPASCSPSCPSPQRSRVERASAPAATATSCAIASSWPSWR